MPESSDGVSSSGEIIETGLSVSSGQTHARTVGMALQNHIEGLVSRFRPRLGVLVASLDGSTHSSEALLDLTTKGLRRGIVDHLVDSDGASATDLSDVAAAAVRDELRTRAPDACGQETWIDLRFGDAAFREHMPLSADDRAAIARTFSEARQLANDLALRNKPLADSLARLFRHTGIDLDVLRQEAFVGLRRAALTSGRLRDDG